MSQEHYFATYIQDLEQDPFDLIDFVERLAWRMSKGDQIDAEILQNKFEEEIGSLQLLSEQFQSKITALEQQQGENKTYYLDSLARFHDKNAESLDKLKQLDNTMQTISAKVIHLGDQLESVHAPRARAFEALQLMRHFDEFLADQPLNSPIFTDPDRLLEAAEMICKLYSIAQELSKEKYAVVQMRIAHKYDEIEELLIEEFSKSSDKKRLREIAIILSEFKGFSRCLDGFVERVQNTAFRTANVFEDILVLCEKINPTLNEIFPNPDQVISKLVLNVFQGKLQETVNLKLKETKDDPETYLRNLHDLYLRTLKLQKKLEKLKSFDSDPQFLPTLVQSIFGPYLVTYSKIEQKFINDQCAAILQRFYASKNHQKRNIQSGGLQDLKRDIQARLLSVENFNGETFLSEEVAINLIQEIKNAFIRCNLLCKRSESLELTESLFDMLIKYLYLNHVDYAIELALASISLAEPKTEPAIVFFDIVQQSSSITHLFVKNFDDVVYNIIKETRNEDSLIKKRDQTLGNVENRINLGLERQLNALIGYVRFVLSTEQKRSDFKPEDESKDVPVKSKACKIVTTFLTKVVARIKDSIDGENLKIFLTELGERLYNVLLVHIKSFSYNATGAMLLIYDMNEYKNCVYTWGTQVAFKKIDLLRELAGLLVIIPEKLSEASTTPTLINLDRALINSFIQLRHDYKSAKIYTKNY